MKKEITIENNNLVIRIPLKQNRYNIYMGDDPVGVMDNILGVIEGDEFGFAHWIDMDYSGKEDQISEMFYKFWGSEDEFKELCKELNIYCFEYSTCSKCNKVLYGSFTWGDKGPLCFDCESKK